MNLNCQKILFEALNEKIKRIVDLIFLIIKQIQVYIKFLFYFLEQYALKQFTIRESFLGVSY